MKKRRQVFQYSPYQTSHLLYQKYHHQPSCTHNQLYLKNMNNCIDRQLCQQTVEIEDVEIWINQKQFLKRSYTFREFQHKIEAITEYYKFQTNIPQFYDTPIHQITKKYKNQKDRIKRKQIKKFMKENHGVQISSVDTFSQSSCTSESNSRKNNQSKYSDKLSKILSNRTSFMLEGICNEINYALKNVYSRNFIKGKFESKEDSFRKFLTKKSTKSRQQINRISNENKYQSNQAFHRKYKTKSVNNLKKIQPKSFSKATFNETNSKQQIKNGFRKRKMKKNNTKSLTRVFPEVIKTEGKHQSTKEIKRQIIKNQPALMLDKSLNYMKRRIMSGKVRKQNEDMNKITRLPSLNKIKPKHSIEGTKSKKLVKGMRPSSANLKSRPKIGASPNKINHQTIQIFPKNQSKGIQALIRKKLQIR